MQHKKSLFPSESFINVSNWNLKIVSEERRWSIHSFLTAARFLVLRNSHLPAAPINLNRNKGRNEETFGGRSINYLFAPKDAKDVCPCPCAPLFYPPAKWGVKNEGAQSTANWFLLHFSCLGIRGQWTMR